MRALQFAFARSERATLMLRGNRQQVVPCAGDWLGDWTRSQPDLLQDLRFALANDREAERSALNVARLLNAGRVPVLGAGPLPLGDPPDWHRDPLSDRRTPLVHWSRIDYLNFQECGDHKFIWEPNRHQYLLQQAIAWAVSEDEAHIKLLRRHVASWIDANPFRVGINWASSLEVAYRAIAWCWLFRIAGRQALGTHLVDGMATCLVKHARHVRRYLSTYFSPNTHLTGEALGLYTIGTVLDSFSEASQWRRAGADILESALRWQIRADGTYFEQATQYHRYTAEIYLHYLRLAEWRGDRIDPRVKPALNGLFDVLRAVADARGRIPLSGDDDGGSLLPLDGRPPDDVRSLLLAGATALRRPELAFPGASPLLATVLCGRAATARVLETCTSPRWCSRAFKEGGVYIMRDGWGESATVAVIDTGPHGATNCGHAHADALAMTLSLGQSPLFVDRGTFTYTGPERNEFRSTLSHNTVEFDDESSAEPSSAFAWRSIPPPPVATSATAGGLRWVSAISHGHVASGRPSVHRRVLLSCADGPWLVLDRAERPELRKAVARWYLAPGATPNLERSDLISVVTECTVPALASIAFPCSAGVVTENRDVSSRLGERSPSKVMAVLADSMGRIVTLVSRGPASWVSDSPPGRPGATWTCSIGSWRHSVSVRPDGAPLWQPFGVATDAELAWCIEPLEAENGESARLCLVGGRDASMTRGAAAEERNATPIDVGVLVRAGSEWRALPTEEFGRSATE